jgi:anthranilate phosphoribosyltransferase
LSIVLQISPEGDTFVWFLDGGAIKEMVISPKDFGLPSHPLSSVVGGNPAENAETMRALFSNKLEGPIKDFVLMNAGALLFIASKAGSLAEGVSVARTAIEDGSALRTLHMFADVTKPAL